MATSGSSNYTQTRDQIISDALMLLGVLGANDTATANDVTFCSNMLNKMVKGWQGQGIHLWKESEAIVTLTDGQYKYVLSSSSNDEIGDNAVETTLSASASGTSLTVVSTSGMTVGDEIVIALDDNTSHATTIATIPSTTTLTINVTLPSAAASGNSVITFTSQIARPLNVTSARYHYVSGLERKMTKYGREQYMQIPTKYTSEGPSTVFYFSPQLNEGHLYVWPVPNDVNDSIHISYIKTIEDFDSSSDNPDFPQEWLNCLTYNLAVMVAPAYGGSLSKVNPDIAANAQQMLLELQAWDSEEGSIHITPNYRFDD
jgi:hypothetical protein